MGVEIERKFLVRQNLWRPVSAGMVIRQGYISLDKQRIVRVRTVGQHGFLTIKGATADCCRAEFEYEIPYADALELLAGFCIGSLLEKRRYQELYGGHKWEIDVFAGENEGLIIAEAELATPDEQLVLPPWVGSEVSGEARYFNACLITAPYSHWPIT